MQRLLALAVVVGALAGGAGPARGTALAFSIVASPPRGGVPLDVSFSAAGEAVAVHWEFGDGTPGADGPSVLHTFAQPGVYVVVATATLSDGTTAEARATVTALRIAFTAPAVVGYRHRATFRGRVEPRLAGLSVRVVQGSTIVGRTRTRRGGTFALTRRLRAPGQVAAEVGGVRSAAVPVSIRPRIALSVPREAPLGGLVRVHARAVPRWAGRVTLTVSRAGRPVTRRVGRGGAGVALKTPRLGRLSVRATLEPRAGFLPRAGGRWLHIRLPALSYGARGPLVLALERRLRELGYALPRVDRTYGWDTAEAVLAFRKLNGLPWRTTADRSTWRRLARAHRPRPRHGYGDHIEVSKSRQVLLVVRRGRVDAVLHVSTGATGNTPVGRWRVYRKVVGWDWVLWYPSYFLRGFAVHGYPSVPAYPASHGCVRVPMWAATRLYTLMPYGSTIWIDP